MKFKWMRLENRQKNLCFEGEEGDNPPGGGNPNSQKNDPPPPPSVDPDVVKAKNAEIERLRAESEAAKAKARELEEKEAQREREKLEEEGNFRALAEKESERAEAAHREKQEAIDAANKRIINSEIRSRLVAEGVTDTDFHILLDRTNIKLDAEGNVVGLDEAIKTLRDKKPSIFTKPSTIRSANNPAPAPNGDKHAKDVRKMTKDEYAKYRREKLRSFKGGRR